MLIRDFNENDAIWTALRHRENFWLATGILLKYLFFGGCGDCLCSPSICLLELICSLYSHLRPEAVRYQGLVRTTVRFCSHTHWSSSLQTEGMFLVRSFCNDCRLISQVRVAPRCATLCGRRDYCLLAVIVKSRTVRSGTRDSGSQENPEWQLTFTRRNHGELPTNFKAEVLSLEYKNTWFSEDRRRYTLRFTTCSKGVSKSQLYLFKAFSNQVCLQGGFCFALLV